MATAPTAPMGMDPAAQAPSADQATGMDEGQESFTVCIRAQADGTFSVYAKDSDEGQDDTQGAPDDASGPQTAKSIDEALSLAQQMLEAGAGEAEPEPAADASPEAVWNQLAKKTDAKRGAQ
jgi:hypothetical protein